MGAFSWEEKVRINMTIAEAEALIANRYPDASKPLTKCITHDYTSLDAWLSDPKQEEATHDRKYAAVPFYLHLAAQAQNELPSSVFPVVFEFEDGKRIPDKGLVKALYYKGLLGFQHHGELALGLTEAGRQQFPQDII